MEIKIQDLVQREDNARQHSVNSLARRAKQGAGIVKPIGVEMTPEGPVVVDNWLRVEAMKAAGFTSVPTIANRIGGRTSINPREILRDIKNPYAEKVVVEADGIFGTRYERSKYIIRDRDGEFVADIFVSDFWDDEVDARSDEDRRKAKSFINLVVYGPTIIRRLLDRISDLEQAARTNRGN